MSATFSLTGDWLVSLGNKRQTSGTGNLGVYATDGVAVSAAQLGLGRIDSLVIDPAGGYIFEYVASTGKVKAYSSAASVTPSGTIDGTAAKITLVGGQAAGVAVQITPDTASAVLGKTTATDRDAAAPITGLTFTGDGASASMSEVVDTTNLAGVTFNFRAVGV